jgi:hypothetical protein
VVIASTAVQTAALATVAQREMTAVHALAVTVLPLLVQVITVALKSVAAFTTVTSVLLVMARRVQHVMTAQNVIIKKSF